LTLESLYEIRFRNKMTMSRLNRFSLFLGRVELCQVVCDQNSSGLARKGSKTSRCYSSAFQELKILFSQFTEGWEVQKSTDVISKWLSKHHWQLCRLNDVKNEIFDSFVELWKNRHVLDHFNVHIRKSCQFRLSPFFWTNCLWEFKGTSHSIWF
jgi:hypothetical protein